jgi:hypothetical protein
MAYRAAGMTAASTASRTAPVSLSRLVLRSSFLVVLLDRGVLVVDVQARGDAAGDHSGAEPSRRGVDAGAY